MGTAPLPYRCGRCLPTSFWEVFTYVQKPLEGIRVLDFTNALAGPYCSMMLGNMGAEVIKVEKPGTGDDSRGYGPFVNGQSGYFVSVNHGKKASSATPRIPRALRCSRIW